MRCEYQSLKKNDFDLSSLFSLVLRILACSILTSIIPVHEERYVQSASPKSLLL